MIPELTPRERQIARLVASGLTNRAVAENVGRSYWTVKHILEQQIYEKSGMSNRMEFAVWYWKTFPSEVELRALAERQAKYMGMSREQREVAIQELWRLRGEIERNLDALRAIGFQDERKAA